MTQTIVLGLPTVTNTAQTMTRKRRRTLGQPTETDTPQALHTKIKAIGSSDFVFEVDQALPLTIVRAYGGTFANREDITNDNTVPGGGLLLCNYEVGEYRPDGELATQWFEWRCQEIGVGAPTSVTFSFVFAGQSGSGGASLRVYDDTGEVMPLVGDLVDDDSVSAASGTVSVTITPTADLTYRIQRGLQEKAGTYGYLETALVFPGSIYTPTPVIP